MLAKSSQLTDILAPIALVIYAEMWGLYVQCNSSAVRHICATC